MQFKSEVKEGKFFLNESFTCKFKIVEQKSKDINNENKINMMKVAVLQRRKKPTTITLTVGGSKRNTNKEKLSSSNRIITLDHPHLSSSCDNPLNNDQMLLLVVHLDHSYDEVVVVFRHSFEQPSPPISFVDRLLMIRHLH